MSDELIRKSEAFWKTEWVREDYGDEGRVEIILAELKLLFDNEDNVKEWKNYKLDRLEKQLKEKAAFNIMSGVYDLSEV